MTKTQKRIYDLTHAARNGWDIAAEIAAEIDDLTERNAFLLTSAETAQAKLAEARAAVRDLTVSLENSERHVNDKDTIISELFVWENDPADSRTFAEFLDYLGALYPSAKMW